MLRSAIRRDSGFSLPELLIALSIAMIVSLATFSLVEFVMKRAGETQNMVASNQRGRLAMDTITRQLRSQVCLNTDLAAPPMSAPTGFGIVTDSNTAVFYGDFSDGSDPINEPPQLHAITYDPVKKTLIERDYAPTSVTKTATAYAYTWPLYTAPTRKVTLLENVVPYGSAPIFTYYTYNTASPPRPDQLLTPGPGGLSAADTARVARIDIQFRAVTTTKPTVLLRGSTVLQDQVYVRAADPNDPAPTPTCA
jgi:prepilin-type N-terminal cleavage/methylation domain-containing protein